MCEILARYLVEIVAGAHGNADSFIVGDVARWAETKIRPNVEGLCDIIESALFNYTKVAK
jgi:hypothetical protein